VDALGRISVYEGALGERPAIVALLAIARGPYDSDVRQGALSVLLGRPNAGILDSEE